MVEFDLAEVVVAQKEATTCRCCDRDNIAFTFRDQAGQRRIVLENEIHLPLEASCETLPTTTQRRALSAHVMKNTIGKSEKYRKRLVCYGFHEAPQNITKRWPA
jgi:hypothetical protein